MVIFQKISNAVMPLVYYCIVVVQGAQEVPVGWHPFTHRCTQSEAYQSSVKRKWFHFA